jgi:SAM-dependent methyltransferase
MLMTRKLWKALVPLPVRRWLSERRQSVKRSLRPYRRDSDFVSLRRTTPVCTEFGPHGRGSRGLWVDRYYIEQFLAAHAVDIRGHILDFGDDFYARRFGGTQEAEVDVFDIAKDNPRATIISDLSRGENIPSDTFDCIICTQVLLLIYNIHAAVRTLYRILKPGGIVLVTVPGVAHKISRTDMEQGGDYWRFTTLSLRRLFEEAFPQDHVEVKASGNVLSAIALLHGFAVEDLRREDLEYSDPDFEVSISLRAVKPTPVAVA